MIGTDPYIPNCARAWIICGTPSFEPCAECSAMNTAPTRLPTTIARTVDFTSRPKMVGPRRPVTTASGMIWTVNQKEKRCWTFPVRCDSGTGWIVSSSTSVASCDMAVFLRC